MIKCVNSNCQKDADTLESVVVNEDGDFACCIECSRAYYRQRDRFFNETIQSEALTIQYLCGGENA